METVESEAKKVGWGQMYSNLKEIDPQAAESIEPSDSQRILRALEVNKQSDISFSDLKKIINNSKKNTVVPKISVNDALKSLFNNKLLNYTRENFFLTQTPQSYNFKNILFF